MHFQLPLLSHWSPTMKRKKGEVLPDLRLKAENSLYSNEKAQGILPLLTADKFRLIHELQVHQVELEMQNDELRRVQAEIKELEALRGTYAELYDFAPIAYFALDADARILNVNHAGAALLESETHDLMGKSFQSFVATSEGFSFIDFLRKVSRGKTRQSYEVKLVTARQKQIFVRIEAVAAQCRQEYRITLLDITERENANAEMLKMQKLQSLGVLAAGIAHDFNNILTGILGNISLARKAAAESQNIANPLSRAEKACWRGAALAKQLLTFAKGGVPVKKAVSARQCVEASAALVLPGSKVNCVINIPTDVHPVEVDEGQINQAFNNIILNSAQAMPGGGTITITAQNIALDDTNFMSLAAGEYVVFSFTDTGYGISAHDLKNIFDPYFTTKSEGHGIGLSTCYSIIRKHGGYIGVRSLVGKGTTFGVVLPALCEEVPEAEPDIMTMPTGEVSDKSPMVLVMDDEELIRSLALEFLQMLGYQGQACSDGKEAIALFKEAAAAGRPFAAVILDLTIPGGIGGKDAAEQILAIDPHARMIVSSGYSDDPVMADYKRYGFCDVLEKPYTVDRVSQVLRGLLSGVQKGITAH